MQRRLLRFVCIMSVFILLARLAIVYALLFFALHLHATRKMKDKQK